MGYSRVAKKLNEAKKPKKQQFSLRKSSVVGVASVIVGTVGFLSGTVQADDLTDSTTTMSMEVVTNDSSNSETTNIAEQVTSSSQPVLSTEVIDQPVVAEVGTNPQTEASNESTSPSKESDATLVTSSEAIAIDASTQKSELNSNTESSTPEIESVPSAPTEVTNQVQTQTAIQSKSVAPVETVETVSADVSGHVLKIVYNGQLEPTKKIKYAVWTDNAGQDDLVWYTADQVGAAYIDLSKKHRAYGLYNIHTYSQDVTGKMSGLNARQFTILKPTVSTSFNVQTNGLVDIVVSNVRGDISSIKVPVWSDLGGQNDIKWYQATQSTDGTYKVSVKISDHSNDTGHFAVHVYGNSTITNSQIGLGTTEGFTIATPDPQNVVSAVVANDGFHLALNSNVVKEFTKVKFAVWSDQAGQDDLHWYTANAQGQVIVPYVNHSNYGLYNIHTYSFESGSAKGLNTRTITVPNPTASAAITQKSDLEFLVSVTNVPAYITKVMLPSWSEINGQDDIKWVTASKLADNSYQAIINIGDHKYNLGHYLVHIYGYSQIGSKTVGLAGTSGFDVKSLPAQTGQLTISPLNNSNFTFTATVSNVYSAKGVKNVKFAVWSDKNGQDELQWLSAQKNSASTYSAVIDLEKHKFDSGLYHVHVYYDLMSGEFVGQTSGTTTFSLPAVSGVAAKIDGTNGFVPSVSIRNLLASAIKVITDQGYQVGFTMFDAISKQGLSYNSNQKFYVASSIKGIYVASLVAQNPLAFNTNYTAIKNILYYSDNDAYANLRATYGAGYIANWMAKAGVDTSLSVPGYPYVTSNELAKLWGQNYSFFNTTTKGKELSKLYENPNLSPIHAVLGSSYRTMSKAGWIGMTGYHAANDAGIVSTGNGDYIISITTNADGKLGLLNNLVSALNTAYKEI